MFTVGQDFASIVFLVLCVQDPSRVLRGIKYMFALPQLFISEDYAITQIGGIFHRSGTLFVRASVTFNRKIGKT